MAQFYLDRDTKAELGYSSSPVSVNGTAGSQDRIILRSNATEVAVSSAVEIVDFAGSVSAYSFQAAGRGVAVYRGDDLVATVAFNDAGSSELRFSEGGIVFTQDADTGAYTVGGWTVPAGEESVPEAWAGESSAINTEHKSEAGGGGPTPGPQPGPTPGQGQDYVLPADLGDGNLVTSGTGNDTYTTTTADGLRKDAQIIDGSTADADVLTMDFSKENENGSIVNVEKIVANWTGYNYAVFDAEDVSHVNGTEITVNTSRSVFDEATVRHLQNHHAVAGTGIKFLTVTAAEEGAAVTMGDAVKLTVDKDTDSADRIVKSTDTLTVNAEKDFELILADTANAGYSKKDRDGMPEDDIIVVNASRDVVVKAGTGVATAHATNGYANIFKAADSAGTVTVDFGSGNVSGNVSGLQVDVIRTTNTGGSNVFEKLNAATTVELAGASASGTFTNSADEFSYAKGDPNTATARVNLADATIGTLTITDGGVGTLFINADLKTTIAGLSGCSSAKADDANNPKKVAIAADSFVLSGRGDVTVSAFSTSANPVTTLDRNDVTLVAGDDYTGRLEVTNLKSGIVAAGQGGGKVTVNTATGGVDGDATFAGGAGKDEFIVSGGTFSGGQTVTFDGGAGDDKATVKDNYILGDGNGGELKLNLGDGDDTVTLEGTFGMSGGGNLNIDFGAGARDTLVVKKSVNLATNADKDAVTIKNLDILDLSDASGDLTVLQSQFATYDFQVKGGDLKITLEAGKDLDLSAMKASDTSTGVISISGTGSAANAATLTLDKAGLTEEITLSGGGATADDHFVLVNFKGNEDTLSITSVVAGAIGTSGDGTTYGASVKAGSGGFSKLDDSWITLQQVVDGLAKDSKAGTASGDVIGFKFEGSTYFMIMDSGNTTFNEKDTLIELAGDSYTASDFNFSIDSATVSF